MELRLPNYEYIPIFSEDETFDRESILEELDKHYIVEEVINDIPKELECLKNDDDTYSFKDEPVEEARAKSVTEIRNILSAYEEGELEWNHVEFLIGATFHMPPICLVNDNDIALRPYWAYGPSDYKLYFVGSARVSHRVGFDDK